MDIIQLIFHCGGATHSAVQQQHHHQHHLIILPTHKKRDQQWGQVLRGERTRIFVPRLLWSEKNKQQRKYVRGT